MSFSILQAISEVELTLLLDIIKESGNEAMGRTCTSFNSYVKLNESALVTSKVTDEGAVEHRLFGQYHCPNGPALHDSLYNNVSYYCYGKAHRIGGPADILLMERENTNGETIKTKYSAWYENGKFIKSTKETL